MIPSCDRVECDETCVGGPVSGPRRPWRQAVRALLTTLAVPVAVLLVLLAGLTGPRRSAQRRRVRAIGRGSALVLAALGVRTVTFGSGPPRGGLVVGNHVSWLDVLVLAAAAPARDVAKAEVAGWPVVGGLARRAGTVFVRRNRWRGLPAAVRRVEHALRRGERVLVFPEATTRCGGSVGTFRRAMFQAAIDTAVPVAPVALAYRDGGGLRTTAPAFVGDEGLAASLRRILVAGRITVEVHWLPTIPAIVRGGHRSRDRAILAALAQRAITVRLGVPVAGGVTAGPAEMPEQEDLAV